LLQLTGQLLLLVVLLVRVWVPLAAWQEAAEAAERWLQQKGPLA
jgi:hypothetical protein